MKILLTGASGIIGRVFFKGAQDRYQIMAVDRTAPDFPINSPHQFVQADLSDAAVAAEVVQGVDAIVHLAGNPSPKAEFDDLLPNNILTTTYLMQAAADARVRRFVFASSAQTIEGYPVDIQVNANMATSPANLYGVTKCYGEALGAYHANRNGLSCVAIRIAAFDRFHGERPKIARDLSAWLSHRDAVHLFQRAIEAEDIGFFIAAGISNNRFKRMDLRDTCRVLGYAPQDDAFVEYDVKVE